MKVAYESDSAPTHVGSGRRLDPRFGSVRPTHANSCTWSNAYGNPDRHSERDPDSHCNVHSDPHTDAHRDEGTNPIAYGHGDTLQRSERPHGQPRATASRDLQQGTGPAIPQGDQSAGNHAAGPVHNDPP